MCVFIFYSLGDAIMNNLGKNEVNEDKKERSAMDRFAITFFKWFGGLLMLSLFLNVIKSPDQRVSDAERIKESMERKQAAEAQRAQRVRTAEKLYGNWNEDPSEERRRAEIAESLKEDEHWEGTRR